MTTGTRSDLCDLMLPADQAESLKKECGPFPSWDLTPRQTCDLELLLNGGFTPLTGFLGQADYDAVVDTMRLADGTVWPMPVVLDVPEAFADSLKDGDSVALRDPEGVPLAVLDVADRWTPDREREAQKVYGTTDLSHPGVEYLLRRTNPVYLGGTLRGLSLPSHYDFQYLRDLPSETRARFRKMGWRRVVGYHTDQPMHKAQVEVAFRAAKSVEAHLLLHPSVGGSESDDFEHFARVRCYEHAHKHFPEQTTALSLMPLAPRWAGPREAVLQAIVRRNFGCTHFVVGLEQASPDQDPSATPYYAPQAAQSLARELESDLGIEIVTAPKYVFVQERAAFVALEEVRERDTLLGISREEFLRRVLHDREVPEWFSFPEVVGELRRAIRPLDQRGFTVFFTGLSGSGKSTIAKALVQKFLEQGGRRVTLLDGDIVRKNLSSELTFSKEHRDLNILRIGFVASEITKNGGIAICAPIAPYTATRRSVRETVEGAGGGFIEVHVATPIDVCEGRDRKGLYALARAGKIKGFTGIDDPYEVPEAPELSIDTSACSPEEAAQDIILKIEGLGYINVR
ncbi:bifunctional sulfate adenylyltransferase/adenylylsulfate kinase [Magnetospira sp. QH-2]|uniref:bifunctional sulfate adenylyltransferase/adenylylsulfate kinase n=1 Tax=Magnetospira sp. (strain QH-2) TaxID=1288970 RepID=UPI0003E81297|nr:bifunctional sulfate adenylyltransferase/adenylylsulfate kinase [Magnetospira sp. QH-2]CCQ74679.1 sulfate adenylyltransferase/adenylyl-sulfate kinase [Magnetospira sp. QH-2]